MKDADFSFIKEPVLRKNIERVSRDALGLLLMLKNEKVSEMADCLRKTIVIYTASMIEAVVLWKIKQEITSEKIVLKNEWKYFDPKLIHATDAFEIIWAKRREEERSVSKLDFNVMLRVCRDTGIFDAGLLSNLDTVRKLRNEIHIGDLDAVVKAYRSERVKFVCNVLVVVLRLVR